MSFGVTPAGFIRKSREQILSDQQANARLLLGEEIDLSDQSPDGLRLQAQTDELDLLWKTLEDIYYSNYVSTATGISLDRAISVGGQERAKPKRSIVQLQFRGAVGSNITVGTIVQTRQGIQFITIESSEIADTGSGLVLAQCLQFGELGNVASNAITEIVTSASGIESVTNLEPASQGRIIETDAETYTRYKERGVAGGSSAFALQSELNNLQSVIIAKVYENASSIEDADGRPPNSMQAVIEGATGQEIGDLFLKKWPGGIQSLGSESITLQDNKGINRTYFYDRPENVRVYVKVILETNDLYQPAFDAVIKTNCIKVVGGVDANTSVYPGKGIGESLYAWELEASQLGIEDFDTVRVFGIVSINVTIGLTNAPSATTLDALGNQRFKLNSDDIEIVIL